jgi:hypothetical protein
MVARLRSRPRWPEAVDAQTRRRTARGTVFGPLVVLPFNTSAVRTGHH